MFQWEGRWSHVGAMLDSDFSHSTGLFINEDGDAKVKGTGYDPSSYSESYDKREGDILIAGFKDNYEPQMGFNSCVPTGMSYVADFYGKSGMFGNYLTYSLRNVPNYMSDGVSGEYIDRMVHTHLVAKKISADKVTYAINNGNPVMAQVMVRTSYNPRTGEKEGDAHNVIIVGYNCNNNTYIVSDPATGAYRRISMYDFERTDVQNYLYEVSGVKSIK